MARSRMNNKVFACSVLSVMLLFAPYAAAEEENTINTKDLDNGKAQPYKDDEFPAWTRDMRHAEIVLIGSLPFTTLASTLCYSLGRYTVTGFDFNYVPNPFAKSGAGSLNQTEQIGVFAAAGGLSICIGVTDLIVRIHRRRKKERVQKEKSTYPVIITPMEEDNPEEGDINSENAAESRHYPPPTAVHGEQ